VAFTSASLLQSSVPGLTEHRIANIFKPLASPADSEYQIALFVFAITGAIFVVVAGLLIYTLVRFRRKAHDDTRVEPPQVYGSNQIELAWTVMPVLIVFVLVGVTARIVTGVEDAKEPASAIKATLVGHRWWWEIRYPDLGVVTANELHVPVAGAADLHPTFLRLESRDVLHSFWVPQLAGKTNLIPNRVNSMWMDPRETGVYLGNCAEFCGVQHANMLLRVIVHTPDEFDRWVAAQRKPAEDNAQVTLGKTLFRACGTCHTIQGDRFAKGTAGPDLTHLMSRQTIGAGVLTNTADNLRNWVVDAQKFKPGCLMPSMKLTDRQQGALLSYLQTLN
jgi:cytochrome c oxidase subunit II